MGVFKCLIFETAISGLPFLVLSKNKTTTLDIIILYYARRLLAGRACKNSCSVTVQYVTRNWTTSRSFDAYRASLLSWSYESVDSNGDKPSPDIGTNIQPF